MVTSLPWNTEEQLAQGHLMPVLAVIRKETHLPSMSIQKRGPVLCMSLTSARLCVMVSSLMVPQETRGQFALN